MLSLARAWAKWALKVLFPTPPFPDSTRILCLTADNFSPISAMAADETGKRRWNTKMGWRGNTKLSKETKQGFALVILKLLTFAVQYKSAWPWVNWLHFHSTTSPAGLTVHRWGNSLTRVGGLGGSRSTQFLVGTALTWRWLSCLLTCCTWAVWRD